MKKTIIYIATMLLLLSSCSETLQPQNGEIQFNIGYPATKATSSAFESGDAISLYAVTWNGGTQYPLQVGGNFLNNERLAFNGSSWSPSQTLYWGAQPCDFYALYPYQASVGSVEKYPFTLATDQNTSDGYENSDLLFAYAENVSPNTTVALNFKHIMSKLVVNLVKGPDFDGDIPNDIVAHVYNTITACTVDWTKGSIEKDAFGAKPTLTMKKISNERFEAVIVPQNIEKRTPLIELTMGGIAYLLEYSLSFRPGYVHTVTVTLNTSPDQEQIEISIDPETNNWN